MPVSGVTTGVAPRLSGSAVGVDMGAFALNDIIPLGAGVGAVTLGGITLVLAWRLLASSSAACRMRSSSSSVNSKLDRFISSPVSSSDCCC